MIYFPVSKPARETLFLFPWSFNARVLLCSYRCQNITWFCSFFFLSCFALNNFLIALGSIVLFEARTINEYIITVFVSEK